MSSVLTTRYEQTYRLQISFEQVHRFALLDLDDTPCRPAAGSDQEELPDDTARASDGRDNQRNSAADVDGPDNPLEGRNTCRRRAAFRSHPTVSSQQRHPEQEGSETKQDARD